MKKSTRSPSAPKILDSQASVEASPAAPKPDTPAPFLMGLPRCGACRPRSKTPGNRHFGEARETAGPACPDSRDFRRVQRLACGKTPDPRDFLSVASGRDSRGQPDVAVEPQRVQPASRTPPRAARPSRRYTAQPRPSGEIGRHKGLKIP